MRFYDNAHDGPMAVAARPYREPFPLFPATVLCSLLDPDEDMTLCGALSKTFLLQLPNLVLFGDTKIKKHTDSARFQALSTLPRHRQTTLCPLLHGLCRPLIKVLMDTPCRKQSRSRPRLPPLSKALAGVWELGSTPNFWEQLTACASKVVCGKHLSFRKPRIWVVPVEGAYLICPQ